MKRKGTLLKKNKTTSLFLSRFVSFAFPRCFAFPRLSLRLDESISLCAVVSSSAWAVHGFCGMR